MSASGTKQTCLLCSPEQCLLSGVKRTSRFEVVMSAFDPKRTLDLGPTRFRRVHFGELNEFPSLEELFRGNQADTLRCINSRS